jgi:putative ATP-binding cassette transporter
MRLGSVLLAAWRLAWPYFASERKWFARLLLAAIVALRLSLVGMSVILSYWNRAFYNALQEKDWDSFVSLLFLGRRNADGFMPGFCAVAALFILVAVYRTYLTQWLTIGWREWMTGRLQGQWLTHHAYWRISLASFTKGGFGTDNPDQRIAEDVRDFIEDSLSLSLGLLSAVVTLFSFVTILWTLSGAFTLWGITVPGYMVWVALLYAAFGSALTHTIGKPLAALRFRQQKVEADFRFSLARLRENVEGIALSGGEAEEQRALKVRFAAVVSNWRSIMGRTKLLTFFTAGFDQAASVFPLVVASPRYFAGQVGLGALTQTSSAFSQVEGAMTWFVHSYQSLASWTATVDRLSAFERAIATATRQAGGPTMTPASQSDFVLRDTDLQLPDGTVLTKGAGLTLHAGESVLIAGRSGLGKSTLFRALAGIWPYGSGTVERPSGRSMFLPQRPYIPLGTLRQAIAYPASPDAYPDAELRETLDACGLGHLSARLDTEDAWSQRLSGGEQQRLAVARALLARPDWLFLDEATASLDSEGEAELYALLARRLDATTIVSIAHRPGVAAFHQRRVVLESRDGGPASFVDRPVVPAGVAP